MSDTLAIDVHGLTKRFGEKTAVNKVDIAVPTGEVWGFLGPNGSGKTTTIRMLCGLLRADEGEGTCLGLDFRTQSERIKRQVGYMTQRFSFWEDLSIRENLDFVARIYGLPERQRNVDETLQQLGLTERQNQLAGQLSGGWKQRLALAACMLHDPKLLLLDEPTAGVDPKARRDFWDEIHELSAAGITVLVSTHYMDEAERCDRIVYILNGNLDRARHRGRSDRRGRPAYLFVHGEGVRRLSAELRGKPGAEYVAFFGAALHVSGRDKAALDRALEPYRIDAGDHRRSGRAQPRRRLHPSAGAGAMSAIGRFLQQFSGARVYAVLLKEFIQMRRDRLTFAMILGIPIVQLFIFGYAINLNPKNLPTAIAINDPGVFARSLTAALRTSEYFKIVKATNSPREARRLLNEGKVAFVVEIPVNFTRDLVRGAHPQLLVEADATDPSASSYALAAFSQLITSALRNDLTGALAKRAGTTPPFDLVIHRLYNPESITQYNVVPGLLGVILTMTMVLITSLALTRERERGTFENLLAMPATPLEVMLGKITPYVVVGYMQATLILLAARWIFGVPMLGSFSLLSVALAIFIIANLALGYTFSTVAENQLQAMQMTFFFFLPSILLSGFMFPFDGMPGWAQVIGEVLPLTHFLRIVRGLLLKGDTGMEIWPDTVAASSVYVRHRLHRPHAFPSHTGLRPDCGYPPDGTCENRRRTANSPRA